MFNNHDKNTKLLNYADSQLKMNDHTAENETDVNLHSQNLNIDTN